MPMNCMIMVLENYYAATYISKINFEIKKRITNAIFKSDVMLKTRLTSIYTIKHQKKGLLNFRLQETRKRQRQKGVTSTVYGSMNALLVPKGQISDVIFKD